MNPLGRCSDYARPTQLMPHVCQGRFGQRGGGGGSHPLPRWRCRLEAEVGARAKHEARRSDDFLQAFPTAISLSRAPCVSLCVCVHSLSLSKTANRPSLERNLDESGGTATSSSTKIAVTIDVSILVAPLYFIPA